jgi:hypothetical protein
LQAGRRYTLTHNDLTGNLTLSIGREYNRQQLDGWYTRILRDEVLAEWRLTADGGPLSLHVFCHVSGEEGWPAPPALRNFIFQREMTLVLDSIAHAERALLDAQPAAAAAHVFVHLISDLEDLNRIVAWGQLGDRSTWQKGEGGSVFKTLLAGLFPPPPPAAVAQSTALPAAPTAQPAAAAKLASGGANSVRPSSPARLVPTRMRPASWAADSAAVDGRSSGLAPVEAIVSNSQGAKKQEITR